MFKAFKERQLREAVAFCITENSGEYRNNLHLHEYLSNAMIDLKIPKEYCIISEAEWDIAKIILGYFQKDMGQLYATNRLSLPKSRYTIPGLHYFMYSLQAYLGENQAESRFYGNAMHEKTISRKDYGLWGGRTYDATYALSGFGLVFHKMLYASHLFCKHSQVLNSKNDFFNQNKALAEIIDKKQISISRM